MPVFLLIWNSENWKWEALDEYHERFLRQGSFEIPWCCGSNTSLPPSSRVFLLKQGTEPRGIMASGVTVSGWYPAPCWNPMKECFGGTVPMVDVRFDKFLNPNKEMILSRDRLMEIANSGGCWDIPVSGKAIEPAIADGLEGMWLNFLSESAIGAHGKIHIAEDQPGGL